MIPTPADAELRYLALLVEAKDQTCMALAQVIEARKKRGDDVDPQVESLDRECTELEHYRNALALRRDTVKEHPARAHDTVRLTARELQIAHGIVAGHTTKEICGELGIETSTFYAHRFSMMKKLGVRDDVALVHYARKHGWVMP